jgi:hypothetical protein
MNKPLLSCVLLLLNSIAFCQADHEIQVYSSPMTEKNITFFELHSNYTFRGMDGMPDPSFARNLNESAEITHGFGGNFELGVYFFTTLSADGHYYFAGSHIRPRYTIPDKWKWPFGASISAEFGFFRPDRISNYIIEGELRPIIDKTFGNWYFSFNPNMDFALSGNDKHLGITPQFKTVYTMQQKVGLGFEYYSMLGTVRKIVPAKEQEHLIGPMLDLYFSSNWEFNSGYLFGLTPGSNHGIFKLVLGRRIGKTVKK